MREIIRKVYIKNILMFAFGITLTALAISQFTLPNKIVGGGVSGISTILFHILEIEPGISTAVINALLLLAGLKVLGKKFVVATLAGVVTDSAVFYCLPLRQTSRWHLFSAEFSTEWV